VLRIVETRELTRWPDNAKGTQQLDASGDVIGNVGEIQPPAAASRIDGPLGVSAGAERTKPSGGGTGKLMTTRC
jgi:hypothetical protein